MAFFELGKSPQLPVLARYYRSTAQAISNNTATILDFATQSFDVGGNVTTGASWKFTAPITGIYEVSAQVLFASTTTWAETELAEIFLYKNGVVYSYLDFATQFGNADTYMHLSGFDLLQLNAGDYIDVRVLQDSGGSLNLYIDEPWNYVNIKLISLV
jgi:cobalamin biosynthesis Mg chelatase CobN